MRRVIMAHAAALVLASAPASAAEKAVIGNFAIDRTEVTIAEFTAFATSRPSTEAERNGGGFEYSGGWTKRPGWTWKTPFGKEARPGQPAVHVTWSEARDYCASVGGRLPTSDEWRRAAYTETRADPPDGFVTGKTYAYPVGDKPDGMNNNRSGHVEVGTTRRGVNGLYDMGGNAWEWLADRRGEDALTAGGSKRTVADLLRDHVRRSSPLNPAPAGNWRLSGLPPGTGAWFDTGPGARAHLDEPGLPPVEPVGLTPSGFLRCRLRF